MEKYFMHRIKHNNSKEDNAAWDKGIEVHDTLESAKQAYHAYLGAYAYGHSENIDLVSCMISNEVGSVLMAETWNTAE